MPQIIRQGVAAKWRSERLQQARKSLHDKLRVFKGASAHQRRMYADLRKTIVFGKKFLSTFPEIEVRGKKRKKFALFLSRTDWESPVSIALNVQDVPKGSNLPGAWHPRLMQSKLAEAGLEFDKNSVIMTLQGRQLTEREQKAKPLLDLFKNCSGKSWADFLVERVEEHARQLGFKQCKIREPSTLVFYQTPVVSKPGSSRRPATDGEKLKIRQQMHKLYDGTALSHHYRKEGEFWVKDL
ncbi:MAG: hypothetical protein Q7R70_03365 [Candidatus Diapherotrites archaeon]|nr:hypothetical protein [Candidatus Diapherotrites archaeon]